MLRTYIGGALPRTFQPLLYAACAFAAGVLLASRVWHPPLWLLLATLTFVLAAAMFLRRSAGVAAALVLAAFATLGALSAQVPRANHSELLTHADGAPVQLTGTVIREGEIEEGYYGGLRQMLDLEVDSLSTVEGTRPLTGGARLSLFLREREPAEDTELPPVAAMRLFRVGERIKLTAKLRPPRNYGNPGSFDYREYLAQRGIVVLGSANVNDVQFLAPSSPSLFTWRSHVRRALRERMQRLWPGADAGLLGAMLLGDRAHIGRDTRRDFQRTGVYHVLVVSGMHVGILALTLMWLWRRLRLAPLAATLLTIAACALFAFLVDSGAPVVRAAIMVSAYLLTRLLYRERMPLNAIGAAALILLVMEPRALFDASLQLTFVAVLAIAGIGVPLVQRTLEPYRLGLRYFDSPTYDLSLAPRIAQFRVELRLLISRLERLVGRAVAQRGLLWSLRWTLAAAELIVITAVVQLAMALPMAVYFHRASLISLPSNLLVTPMVMLLLPASMLVLLVSTISIAVAEFLAPLAGLPLAGIAAVVDYFAGIRSAEIRVATPGSVLALSAALAGVLALIAVRRRRMLVAAAIAALIASAATLALYRPAPALRASALEITAIDVGQGDSLLVVSPHGKLLLIDGGGSTIGRRSEFDFGEEVVAPYLWSRGITRLDAIALTHAHADHIGGLFSIISNFRPAELWVGVFPDVPVTRALIAHAEASGTRVLRRTAGERFDFGGAEVQVVAPIPAWQPRKRPGNNDSLGLHLRFGQTAALLPGDIERRIEQAIAPELPRAQVLKVPHHGSATSSNDQLLAAVRPEFAIISVGARNSFRHPRGEVLERLRAHQVRTWRTDTTGAVSFYMDGKKVEVRLPARDY